MINSNNKSKGLLIMYDEKAKELFESGYNCSQSVMCAFCDKTGIDIDTAAKLASGFGGGIGRTRNVCGSVTGMVMAAGMIFGYNSPKATEKKRETYQMVQNLITQFENINGSIICSELLGLTPKENVTPNPEKRTKEYYKKRPCALLVKDAAKILEDYINANSNI